MKKMKNIALFAIVFAVLFSFASSAKALDVVSDGVMVKTVGGQTQTYLYYASDSASKYSSDFAWKKLSANGTIVYCADVQKSWPGNTPIEYQDSIDSMDKGLIYLLQQEVNNDADRYVVQGAIWLYRSGISRFEGDVVDPDGLLARMQTLVSQAKSAPAISHGTLADLSNLNDSKMTLNDAKDSFVSPLFDSLVSGVSSYTVSVSGVEGAVIVPSTGSGSAGASVTLNSNQGFYVKVPYANGQNTNKTVTVSVSIQTNAQFISPVGTSSDYQRVIGLFADPKTVTKTFTARTVETVCVDYVIVGNTIPDPALTDPTPEKKCYEKGINYNQENKLTTRTKCVFKGWNTSSDLTGEWIDGTALNNDMTLYGAWDCPSVVVPPTAAQAPFIIAGLGLIGAAGVLGYNVYNKKK